MNSIMVSSMMVHLFLNKKEAKWLREFVKSARYLHDESEDEKMMRMSLFDVLSKGQREVE